MAINRQNNPVGAVTSITDLRKLKFFVQYLRNTPGFGHFYYNGADDAYSIKAALRDCLTKLSDQEQKCNLLLAEAENNILPLPQFDWLNEYPDTCCAIWYYLVNVPSKTFPGGFLGQSYQTDQILCSTLNISPMPVSHSERYESIKTYFDRWILYKNSNHQKSRFMDVLKRKWESFQKEVPTFRWLPEPERDSCEWAWNYLEEYNRKEGVHFRPGIPELYIFKPINTNERFLAISAVLRIWSCHHAEKTLLIKNMTKAWKQRQLRREREDKKAINCYVDIKIKKHLDLLARYNRCQINEMLSDLINKEYALHKEKIDEQFNS